MTQNIQISKRLDDGTILVVGGDNVNDFAANLAGIVGESGRDEIRGLFYELIPTEKDIVQQAVANVQAGFPQAEPVTSRPATPPPGNDAPQCVHGSRKWVTSKPGAAKSWKAWMCPLPQERKSEACAPEWAR